MIEQGKIDTTFLISHHAPLEQAPRDVQALARRPGPIHQDRPQDRKWPFRSRNGRKSSMSSPKLAIVTGASSGIGLELAKLAAADGYDLIVAADTPFVEAGPALRDFGVEVEQIEADLSTQERRRSIAATRRRPSGRRARRQCRPWPRPRLPRPEPDEWMHVINTNVTGTLLLIQPIVAANGRARRGQGADHRFDRGPSRGRLPGGLQRLQGLHRQLRGRAERRDQATAASPSPASSRARPRPSSSTARSSTTPRSARRRRTIPPMSRRPAGRR